MKDCYPKGSLLPWDVRSTKESTGSSELRAEDEPGEEGEAECQAWVPEDGGGLRLHLPGVYAFAFSFVIVPWFVVMRAFEGPHLVLH